MRVTAESPTIPSHHHAAPQLLQTEWRACRGMLLSASGEHFVASAPNKQGKEHSITRLLLFMHFSKCGTSSTPHRNAKCTPQTSVLPFPILLSACSTGPSKPSSADQTIRASHAFCFSVSKASFTSPTLRSTRTESTTRKQRRSASIPLSVSSTSLAQ